jgi:hypothetical protein
LSLYRLQKLAETAAPDDRVWLLQAIAHYEQGEALEAALGIKGARAVIRRNQCLIDAAELLDPTGELGPWKTAGLLEKEIRRVETRGSGKTSSRLDELVLEAFSCGQMIASQRRLYELLR